MPVSRRGAELRTGGPSAVVEQGLHEWHEPLDTLLECLLELREFGLDGLWHARSASHQRRRVQGLLARKPHDKPSAEACGRYAVGGRSGAKEPRAGRSHPGGEAEPVNGTPQVIPRSDLSCAAGTQQQLGGMAAFDGSPQSRHQSGRE